MTAFFISDIHLHPSRPETVNQLRRVLQQMAVQGQLSTNPRLFLLGDIFDTWIGDDDPEPLWQSLKSELRNLNNAGFSLYWIAGNRDFLVGEDFAKDIGCQRLTEPTVISLDDNHQAVLMHGDLLCTQDRHYQWFRRVVRHSAVLWLYRHLPLTWRLTVARKLRQWSRGTPSKIIPLSLDMLPSKEEGANNLKGQGRRLGPEWEKRRQEQRKDGEAKEDKIEQTNKDGEAEKDKIEQTNTVEKGRKKEKDWVDEALSDSLMIQYRANTLIHGHIHQQGIHDRILTVNGTTVKAQRIVLGDWDSGPSVLVYADGQFFFLGSVSSDLQHFANSAISPIKL